MIAPPMTLAQIDRMLVDHADRRFALQSRHGLSCSLHFDGDEQAVVAELLRLARIGAIAEEISVGQPGLSLGAFVNTAHRDWERMRTP